MVERFFPGGDLQAEPALRRELIVALVSRSYRTHVRELLSILWESIRLSQGALLELPATLTTEPEAVELSAAEPPHCEVEAHASALDDELLGLSLSAERVQRVLDDNNGSIERSWKPLGLSSRYALRRLITKLGIEIRKTPGKRLLRAWRAAAPGGVVRCLQSFVRACSLSFFLGLSCAVASPGLAWAEPSAADQARAEALFDEGKRLMDEKRWAEACPKLEESLKIEEAGGTLAALALCHQGQGKTATAWAEFKALLALANHSGHAERKKLAELSLKELEPALIWVRVELSPEQGALPGFVVRLDGKELGKGSWGVSLPVDPGHHTIEAEASGYRPWKASLVLGPAPERRGVMIPALEAVPAQAPSGSASAAIAPAPSQAPRPRSRVPSLVVGGWGAASLLVGGYFGVRALSKMSDANKACSGAECSDDRAIEDSRDASRSAWVANVGVGVGLAGLLASYLLWPPSSGGAAGGRGLKVVGGVDRGGVGLAVLGGF